MPKPTMVKRAALVAMVALVLAGCAGTTRSSKATTPVGEPWVDSNVKGVVTKDTVADVHNDYYVAKAKDWLVNTKIPQDASEQSSFAERETQIQDQLLSLVDDTTKRDHDVTLMRNYYGLAGDWDARNQTGVKPLVSEVSEVEAITTIEGMTEYLAGETVRRRGNYISDDTGEASGETLVTLDLAIDDAKSTNFGITVGVGSLFSMTAAETGLSGSELDYANSPFVERAKYMLGRMGYSDEDAKKMIQRVRDLEERIYAPVVREAERDSAAAQQNATPDEGASDAYAEKAEAANHTRAVNRDELAALAGNYPILRMLDSYGFGGASSLEVTEPAWITELGAAYTQENLEALKGRAILGILLDRMDYLDSSAADKSLECATFELEVEDWMTQLSAGDGSGEGPGDTSGGLAGSDAGDKELADEFVEPVSEDLATRRATISQVASDMPGVVTNAYVTHCYSPTAQTKAVELTDKVIAAYRKIVAEEDWLDPETRDKAIEKLESIEVNVGYPSTLGSTELLEIPAAGSGTSFYEAAMAIRAYNVELTRRAIDNPAEHTYWQNPMEVNAFYSTDENAIFVGCGIIGGRLFDENASIEEQLATFGHTVGHELTHAFDDEGALYDKDGNLTNWWTEGDLKDFNARADKVRDYLGKIKPLGTDSYDGDYVDSEMISDMGGLKAVLVIGRDISGFDYNRFFDAYVIGWESVGSYESVESAFYDDSHPLSATRANVSVMQVQEFYDTYGIKPGDTMYLAPEDRIAVW